MHNNHNNHNIHNNHTIDKLIKQYKLFWQYPVITEREFHDQNITNENYTTDPYFHIIVQKNQGARFSKYIENTLGPSFLTYQPNWLSSPIFGIYMSCICILIVNRRRF